MAENNETALFIAASFGAVRCVRALIGMGATLGRARLEELICFLVRELAWRHRAVVRTEAAVSLHFSGKRAAIIELHRVFEPEFVLAPLVAWHSANMPKPRDLSLISHILCDGLSRRMAGDLDALQTPTLWPTRAPWPNHW